MNDDLFQNRNIDYLCYCCWAGMFSAGIGALFAKTLWSRQRSVRR
jgi:hypothetical protein